MPRRWLACRAGRSARSGCAARHGDDADQAGEDETPSHPGDSIFHPIDSSSVLSIHSRLFRVTATTRRWRSSVRQRMALPALEARAMSSVARTTWRATRPFRSMLPVRRCDHLAAHLLDRLADAREGRTGRRGDRRVVVPTRRRPRGPGAQLPAGRRARPQPSGPRRRRPRRGPGVRGGDAPSRPRHQSA